MDVTAIKSNHSGVSDIDSEMVKSSADQPVVTKYQEERHSDTLIRELGDRHIRTTHKKINPVLNRTYQAKREHDVKKNQTVSESLAFLSDVLSGEKNVGIDTREYFSKKILEGMWSSEKEHNLVSIINEFPESLNHYIDSLADYYFNHLSSSEDIDAAEKFFNEKNIKFRSKSELVLFIRTKLNADNLMINMGDVEFCAEKTQLLLTFCEQLNALPVMKDNEGITLTENLSALKSELNMLHKDAELQDSVRESLDTAQNLIFAQRRSTIDYNNTLSVLMGKLADLRDSIAQRKLENDRELVQLQQKMSQLKVDKDIAEIEKKIKKSERLQTLFKWLGAILTAVMALLTVVTGGALAMTLAGVVAAMSIISEIVRTAGGPDIMAKIMEPVTKLIEVIQKSIKKMVMDYAKALGKSPEELKKLEKTMEIVAMVLAVVAVMALFVAVASVAGSIAGNVMGKVASEATKEAVKKAWAEIKILLLRITLTSTIVNSVSSVTLAELKADIIRQRADLDLDLELMDRITEIMNQIMATFSESQQELIALNEKISKSGKESFQRMKSILQQGPLAV